VTVEPAARAWRVRNLVAVSGVLGVAALVHGFSLPLLSLALEKQGVGTTVIGLSTAVQYLSVLAVAPFVPRLMARQGPVPMMLWSIPATALLLVALPALPNVYAWFVLRFLLGIAESFMWIAGEAWLNHVAEDTRRGRTVALYGMVAGGGFALGPLLLAAVGSEGWLPFALCAAITMLAMLPLLLVRGHAPKLEGVPSASAWRYVLLAPVAMLAYLVFAATDAIIMSFFPIYGVGEGLTETAAIGLIGVFAVGTMAFQLPVGWLMDQVNGMGIVLAAILIMLSASVALPWVIPHRGWNTVFMFAFGGTFAALYIVPLTMLGRRFKGADLSAAAAVFSVMFCVGAVAGPPLSGVGMAYLGNDGMRWALVTFYALALPLPVIGLVRRWQV
jgi:MFS family permease